MNERDRQLVFEALSKNGTPHSRYYRSAWWIERKKGKLLSAGFELKTYLGPEGVANIWEGDCEQCQRFCIYPDVHHKTYERLFAESDDDLIVLCKKCHRKNHGTSLK